MEITDKDSLTGFGNNAKLPRALGWEHLIKHVSGHTSLSLTSPFFILHYRFVSYKNMTQSYHYPHSKNTVFSWVPPVLTQLGQWKRFLLVQSVLASRDKGNLQHNCMDVAAGVVMLLQSRWQRFCCGECCLGSCYREEKWKSQVIIPQACPCPYPIKVIILVPVHYSAPAQMKTVKLR